MDKKILRESEMNEDVIGLCSEMSCRALVTRDGHWNNNWIY
jgi:hypothetical protein